MSNNLRKHVSGRYANSEEKKPSSGSLRLVSNKAFTRPELRKALGALFDSEFVQRLVSSPRGEWIRPQPEELATHAVAVAMREQVALRIWAAWLPDPNIRTRVLVILSAMASDGWVRAMETLEVEVEDDKYAAIQE